MRQNKKVVILFIFVNFIAISSVFSQYTSVPNLRSYEEVPYHFGFYLGVNQMLFTPKPIKDFQIPGYTYDEVISMEQATENHQPYYIAKVTQKPFLGFTIGIVSDLHLSQSFNLRFVPSLSFGERELEYGIKYLHQAADGTFSDTTFFISKRPISTFINLPLHFKYKGSRYHNVRPYIYVGAKYAIDLASKSKKNTKDTKALLLQANDIYGDIGVGLDFYTTYFKFGVDVKMSYGILNVLRQTDYVYSKTLDKLRSKVFEISFTFE